MRHAQSCPRPAAAIQPNGKTITVIIEAAPDLNPTPGDVKQPASGQPVEKLQQDERKGEKP
jgi:hypothetical protein